MFISSVITENAFSILVHATDVKNTRGNYISKNGIRIGEKVQYFLVYKIFDLKTSKPHPFFEEC